MPDLPIDRALQESAEEVLEKMFFIQSLGEPQDAGSEPEVVAHLTFEGHPSGALTMKLTARVARQVASDFLGAEPPDLTEQEVGDVVCELANMICGSFLSRVESSATFRLAVPHILPSGSKPQELAGGCGSASHAMDIGGGRMVLRIETETPAWPTAARYGF